MNYPKRSQYKYAETPYRVRNWPEYEAGLRRRGDVRPSSALKERNRNIRSIGRLGRRGWHKRSGYSQRSMVENTTYRYERIIGREMRARTLAGQGAETRIGCKILNTMTSLGMPDSYRAG